MYNWVSSAYCCSDTLYCEAMSAIGKDIEAEQDGTHSPGGSTYKEAEVCYHLWAVKR